MIQKTFKTSHEDILWKESWINLVMKLRDMPYYSYSSKRRGDVIRQPEPEAKPGTVEVLQKKFGKYIKKD